MRSALASGEGRRDKKRKVEYGKLFLFLVIFRLILLEIGEWRKRKMTRMRKSPNGGRGLPWGGCSGILWV